jgi:hypothetical protein
MLMNVSEAVLSRRSIRAFKDTPVPEDVLRRVLDAARWAVTSVPARDFTCDEGFLKALDPAGNGRIRVSEVIAARDWMFRMLSPPPLWSNRRNQFHSAYSSVLSSGMTCRIPHLVAGSILITAFIPAPTSEEPPGRGRTPRA